VFGRVILNLRCVCACYDELRITVSSSQLVVAGTHTHRRFKITLPNTDYAHEKYHE